VTCATTRTFEEAKNVLGNIQPVEVRRPAIEFLERLAVDGDAGSAVEDACDDDGAIG
jgi:hypothetical protein